MEGCGLSAGGVEDGRSVRLKWECDEGSGIEDLADGFEFRAGECGGAGGDESEVRVQAPGGAGLDRVGPGIFNRRGRLPCCRARSGSVEVQSSEGLLPQGGEVGFVEAADAFRALGHRATRRLEGAGGQQLLQMQRAPCRRRSRAFRARDYLGLPSSAKRQVVMWTSSSRVTPVI